MSANITSWANRPNEQRPLVAVTVPPGLEGVHRLATALGPALDGTGPAIAPLPEGPEYVVDSLRESMKPDSPDFPLENNDVAVVAATSGSTGTPNGVLITADSIRASVNAFGKRFGADARWVVSMPVHRIGGLMVLARAHLNGNPFEIDASVGGARPFDAATFAATTARAVRQSKADGRALMVSLVPTQIARLVEAGSVGLEALASYDVILSGAAATPQPLLNTLRAHNINVVVSYGMTETCGGCVFDGQPLDNVRVTISSDSTRDVGRISIQGPVVTKGYRLRPDLDGISFINGRLLTHDVGRLDDAGFIHMLGRLDDVVTVGGVNVALSAVEQLIRHHTDVAEVAVIDFPDDLWGSIPVAYIVPRPFLRDKDVLISELRTAIAQRISKAATPRIFNFVEAIPMLDSGKVDRLGLRVQAARDVAAGHMQHPGA